MKHIDALMLPVARDALARTYAVGESMAETLKALAEVGMPVVSWSTVQRAAERHNLPRPITAAKPGWRAAVSLAAAERKRAAAEAQSWRRKCLRCPKVVTLPRGLFMCEDCRGWAADAERSTLL